MTTATQAQARTPRWIVQVQPDGSRRIVRGDGLPLGTPRATLAPVPPAIATPPAAPPPPAEPSAPSRFMANVHAERARREADASRARLPVPTAAQLTAWRLATPSRSVEDEPMGQRELARVAGLSRASIYVAEEPQDGHRASDAMMRRVAVALGHPDPAEWGPG